MTQQQKKYILPIALLFVSVFVLFKVIFPEFSSVLDQLNKLNLAKKTNQNLQNTINIINNNFSDNYLEKNLSVVNSALPQGKDILSIFTSISKASAGSGANIKDFSFSLGNLSDSSDKSPVVSLSLNLDASDLSSIISYSERLYNSLPISQINNINFNKGAGATFDINFYYKPYDLNFISDNRNIAVLGPDQVNLLNTLNNFFSR